MPPKKPVKPVPEQDKTQFPLSSVMEAKPKLKASDIFDSKARGQERLRQEALRKEIHKKKREEREKNPKPRRTKK